MSKKELQVETQNLNTDYNFINIPQSVELQDRQTNKDNEYPIEVIDPKKPKKKLSSKNNLQVILESTKKEEEKDKVKEKEPDVKPFCSNKVKGILTLIGGFCIHLVNGTLYTYGLLNPYFISYLYIYNKNLKNDDGFFMLPLGVLFKTLFLIIGGRLESSAGPRKSIIISMCVIFVAHLFLYFSTTITINFLALCLFGLGIGLNYLSPIRTIWKYFPEHKGLCVGIIIAGGGLSSTFLNFVLMKVINPDKQKPNSVTKMYDESIAQNVHDFILIDFIAIIVLGVIGTILVTPFVDPVVPKTKEELEEELNKELDIIHQDALEIDGIEIEFTIESFNFFIINSPAKEMPIKVKKDDQMLYEANVYQTKSLLSKESYFRNQRDRDYSMLENRDYNLHHDEPRMNEILFDWSVHNKSKFQNSLAVERFDIDIEKENIFANNQVNIDARNSISNERQILEKNKQVEAEINEFLKKAPESVQEIGVHTKLDRKSSLDVDDSIELEKDKDKKSPINRSFMVQPRRTSTMLSFMKLTKSLSLKNLASFKKSNPRRFSKIKERNLIFINQEPMEEEHIHILAMNHPKYKKATQVHSLQLAIFSWRNLKYLIAMYCGLYFPACLMNLMKPFALYHTDKLSENLLFIMSVVYSLINGFGRTVWGYLYDNFGYRKLMIIVFILEIIAAVSVYFTPGIPGLFFLYPIAGGCIMGAVMAVIPASITKVFGLDNSSEVYGVVYMTYGVSAFTSPVLSKALNLSSSENDHPFIIIFEVGAALAVIGLIITFTMTEEEFNYDEQFEKSTPEEENQHHKVAVS